VGDQDGDTPDGPAPDEQQDDSRYRKLNRENAALRKRMKEAEAKLKEREEADLSEQEKANRRMIDLQAELEQTRSRVKETALRATVAQEASKLGIVDAEAASLLLNHDALEWDDEAGKWLGVPEAMHDLTLERPWLVQSATPAQDANPANPARRRNRVTREALASMTQAEIDALPWEDVQAALAQS
jgi:hypothetical protein